MTKEMKKKYISPLTEITAAQTEVFMEGATSWTTPDGDHLGVVDGNPDDPDKDHPDESKGYTGWSTWED